MKDILTAPFVEEMKKTTANMYRLGWDERNGGNVSYMLEEDEVKDYLDINSCLREIPLGFDATSLIGKCFIVTGRGKYFKNVESDPETNLGIVRIASGLNVLEFANKYLFKPLGIEPRVNANCKSKEDQFAYLMNKGNHGKVWFMDPTNMPTAGWGLSLSAYEMAQIGLLVLNNGVYNNIRVISEKYIEEMSKSYVSLDYKFGNQDYGYLWWLPHRNNEVIAAIGDGGNIIYINKKYNIVVAVTGYFKPLVFDRVEYIEKNIVEALIK